MQHHLGPYFACEGVMLGVLIRKVQNLVVVNCLRLPLLCRLSAWFLQIRIAAVDVCACIWCAE